MSCESDDPEILEIDRRLEAILGPPVCPRPKTAAQPQALDGILGSRSHVRILRVILRDGDRENLSASEIGRRAGVSHPRALKVLRELEATAVLRAFREAGWSMYEVNSGHPLSGAVRGLFEAERGLTPGDRYHGARDGEDHRREGHVRGDPRRGGRPRARAER